MSRSSPDKPAASRRKFLIGAPPPQRRSGNARLPDDRQGAGGRSACAGRRTWPAKDIFHEYAHDFAKKVNDMTGGDLKIEVLPGRRRGAGVRPARRGVEGHARRRPRRAASTTTASRTRSRCGAPGPAFGMDANMLLSWHKYGGGKELLDKLYASIGANVVSFPYGPMPTQPLGWFKKPITEGRRLQGPQVPHGRHLDRRVHGHGRGGQRAARRRDRPGDGPRPARRGGVQQRHVRPHPRLPGRVRRSACCRATTRTPSSSRSCSTRPSSTRCRRR